MSGWLECMLWIEGGWLDDGHSTDLQGKEKAKSLYTCWVGCLIHLESIYKAIGHEPRFLWWPRQGTSVASKELHVRTYLSLWLAEVRKMILVGTVISPRPFPLSSISSALTPPITQIKCEMKWKSSCFLAMQQYSFFFLYTQRTCAQQKYIIDFLQGFNKGCFDIQPASFLLHSISFLLPFPYIDRNASNLIFFNLAHRWKEKPAIWSMNVSWLEISFTSIGYPLACHCVKSSKCEEILNNEKTSSCIVQEGRRNQPAPKVWKTNNHPSSCI